MSASSTLTAALAARKDILTTDSNAVRLIDGTGDGLPDLFLETYADNLLLSTRRDSLLTPKLENALVGLGKSLYWNCLLYTSPSPRDRG